MIQLAYYADDFTGSTDALESLSCAGLRTMLFLAPPTRTQLAQHPGLQAFGIAGLTRSLAPAAMEAELRPALAALRELAPRHVHYKVCSTFDSSPAVGSIGRAIEIGRDIFGGRYVPLLVGAPALGRYCIFGNLFARMGAGTGGRIFRLDRHPSMSRHPVTPANEADLLLHLAKQTARRTGLVDILKVSSPVGAAHTAVDVLVAAGAEVILFDVLHDDHLPRLGALIDAEAAAGKTVFSVGSSCVGSALAAHWSRGKGLPLEQTLAFPPVGAARPLLVVSGSCSPVTAEQISWAEAHGFACFPLNPVAPDLARITSLASAALQAGRHTVIASSRGPHAGAVLPAAGLGALLGQLTRDLIVRAGVRRILLAGGDISSYIGRALGIESLEMIAPLVAGAPFCRARAPGSPADNLEFVFKGGQVGAPDCFGAVATGRTDAS